MWDERRNEGTKERKNERTKAVLSSPTGLTSISILDLNYFDFWNGSGPCYVDFNYFQLTTITASKDPFKQEKQNPWLATIIPGFVSIGFPTVAGREFLFSSFDLLMAIAVRGDLSITGDY